MSMVEDIIGEVERRPELWMSKHPKFKNTRLKGQLWAGIAAKLNIQGDILKKHWKYLKAQFKKELTKCSTSARSSDDGDQQISSWQHFDQLSFLREEVDELSCDSNVKEARSSDFPMSLMSENMYPFNSLPSNSQRETSETRSILTPMQELEDNNSTVPMPSNPSTSSRPRLSVDAQPRNPVRGEYTKSQVTMTELYGSNDEEYFYLMSILPTMKRLTNVQKMRFRSKIEQFLLEAVSTNEYSSYMNNFNPSNTPPVEGSRKRRRRI